MGCMTNKKIIQANKNDQTASNDITSNSNFVMTKDKSNTTAIKSSQFAKRNRSNVKDDYKMTISIGKGGTGNVFRVEHKASGQLRAMKVIKKSTLSFQNDEEAFIREIEMLKATDHPNIIKIFEHYEDDINYYVIEELIEGGELYDAIYEWEDFNENKAAFIMYQLLCAVNYLHSTLHIIHRDIKPENILVDKKNTDRVNIKLIDFGTGSFIDKNKKFTHQVGSYYYIAPEVLKKKYDEKADVWSCGVILYMLLCGSPPFNGKTIPDVLSSVKKGKYQMTKSEWKNISLNAKDLVTRMLEYNPEQRVSARDALQHPFIKNMTEILNTEVESHTGQVLNNVKKFYVKEKFQQATLAYIVHYIMNANELEDLQKVFRSLDRTGAGRLSYQDVIVGYEKIFGKNYSEDEIKDTLKRMDEDESGFIEYEEFLQAAVNKKNIITEQNLKIAYDRFDLNKDGKLQKSELEEIFQNSEADFVKDMKAFANSNLEGEITFDDFCTLMRKIVNPLGLESPSKLLKSVLTQNMNLKSTLSIHKDSVEKLYANLVYGKSFEGSTGSVFTLGGQKNDTKNVKNHSAGFEDKKAK